MEDLEFIEELKQMLLSIPSARLTHGGRQVGMRCRSCPDSLNPNSYHMSVNLGFDDTPLYFNCFKCGYSGLLSHDKLMSWGVYSANPDIFIKMSNYNKSRLKLDKNNIYRDSPVYFLTNRYISDNKLSEIKLKYINHRLGTNLGYEDMLKNKIVLNLHDLIQSNNIKTLTKKDYIVNQLNESFIGFISEDNAFVNLRNLRPGKVDKSIDFRYVTYSLFNKFDNTRNHYTIPTNIDLLSIDRVKIHISEGSFDILSAYYNLRQDDYNNIYSAISGNRYLHLCKHFILTLGLINIEFHIYIDNDVEAYVVYAIENLCRDFNIPFYLHRNLYPEEKDFGVPIQKIQEQIQRIV